MKFIAHSKNAIGNDHFLGNHLKSVANQMVFWVNNTELNKIFKLTGLLHDLGKYQPEFQRYLNEGGQKGSVPHASWGAALAKKYKLYEAAFAIDV